MMRRPQLRIRALLLLVAVAALALGLRSWAERRRASFHTLAHVHRTWAEHFGLAACMAPPGTDPAKVRQAHARAARHHEAAAAYDAAVSLLKAPPAHPPELPRLNGPVLICPPDDAIIAPTASAVGMRWPTDAGEGGPDA